MKDTPLISVITVCYNSESVIERALSSVANQDWPNIEHIVIDGESTDGTLKILDQFRSDLTFIGSEPDQGIYDAMNKGLDHANGDIVCFLNADDCYTSNSVFSKVAMQMRNHDLDALISDVGFFHPSNPNQIVRRYRSDRFTPERLAWGWMPAHPGLFLSKSVTDRVGYFKTDYKITGDYEYIIRSFYGHNLKYEYLSEIVVNMQLGGASTAGLRAKIELNKEVLRACRENGIKTNIFKILSKYPAKFLEIILK